MSDSSKNTSNLNSPEQVFGRYLGTMASELCDALVEIEKLLYIPGTLCDSRVFTKIDEFKKKYSDLYNIPLKRCPNRKPIPAEKISPISVLESEEVNQELVNLGIFTREQLLDKSPKNLLDLGLDSETVLFIVLKLSSKHLYLKDFALEENETLNYNSCIILLGLDLRIMRILYNHSIFRISDLTAYTKKELLQFFKLGKSGVDEIVSALGKHNFKLKD